MKELSAHERGLEWLQMHAQGALLDLLGDFVRVRTHLEDEEDALGVCVLEDREQEVLLRARRHTGVDRAEVKSSERESVR